MARPSSFTQAKADLICERLSKPESLRSICLDEDMPDRTTVFRWLRDNESFRLQYARACEDRADAIFDEMLEIADDGTNDTFEGEDGMRLLDRDHVQRSKLRVETRKWMLGKMAPKKYGERQHIEHSGSITLEALVSGDDGSE